MKKIILLFIALASVFTLAACGETVENNGETIDFGDILVPSSSIRVWVSDDNGEYMAAVIEEFNKVYPNIVVEFQSVGPVEARDLLKTFGPSGNGADVFSFPHDQLAQAVLEDLLLPLPNSLKTSLVGHSSQLGLDIATLSYDETNGSFDPTSANAVESLFAVPMSLQSVGLFYNKDLVSTPATTMEALLAAGSTWNAALTLDPTDEPTRTNAQAAYFYLGTGSHWADSYFMQPFYSAFGFTPFGPNLNDPSAVGFVNTVAALNFFRDELRPIVTNGGATDSANAQGNFEAGNIPYIIGGPWNHPAFLASGVNYGVAQMPTLNGQNMKTFAGAIMAAVYKYSNNSEDAIKFVEFLTTEVAMELQYEYKKELPALEYALLGNIKGLSENELLLAMAEQLKTSVPMPTIPQVTYYWGPGETMIKDVWNNDVAAATAVATAEASYRVRSGLANQ